MTNIAHPVNVGAGRAARALLAALLICSLPACRRAGPDLSLGVSPRYPCLGEAVTVTFNTRNIDRIEVKDARGTMIAQPAASGAVAVPKIDRSMLPLVATGWKGGDSTSQRIPGDIPLQIIDGTTTTESFALDHKLLGPEDRSRVATENCGCSVDDDGAPLECVTGAPIYEVYRTYEGQDRLLHAAWFSPRAKVVGLVNDSASPLTYAHDGNRIVTLQPGATQMIDFASDVNPAGTWAGRFETNNRPVEYAGRYVDGGKICGGWIHQAKVDLDRKVSANLLLRCME
jgi:hypothetical protein